MNIIYLIISISFFCSSCSCPDNKIYPVPEHLNYSSLEVKDFYTCIVNNSTTNGYKFISNDLTKNKLLSEFYLSYFDNERIEKLDFTDSLKVTVTISSKGKIVKKIQGKYTDYFRELNVPGPNSNNYVTLYLSIDKSSMPFYMNSYKKKGEIGLVNHVTAASVYFYGGIDHTITKLIKDENLENYDTIYSSNLELEYTSN